MQKSQTTKSNRVSDSNLLLHFVDLYSLKYHAIFSNFDLGLTVLVVQLCAPNLNLI